MLHILVSSFNSAPVFIVVSSLSVVSVSISTGLSGVSVKFPIGDLDSNLLLLRNPKILSSG